MQRSLLVCSVSVEAIARTLVCATALGVVACGSSGTAKQPTTTAAATTAKAPPVDRFCDILTRDDATLLLGEPAPEGKPIDGELTSCQYMIEKDTRDVYGNMYRGSDAKELWDTKVAQYESDGSYFHVPIEGGSAYRNREGDIFLVLAGDVLIETALGRTQTVTPDQTDVVMKRIASRLQTAK